MPRTVDPQLNERRRRQILEAATRCVIRRGFHQTSMQEICAEAEMSSGGLYRYFDSKEAIIAAIAEDERAENAAIIHELLRTDNLVKTLQGIMRKMLKVFANTDYGRLGVEVLAEASRNPKVAAVFSHNETELKAALVTALKKAKRAGQIDPGLTLRAIAELLLALIDGLSTRTLVDPGCKPHQLDKATRVMITRLLRPRA
ncbi:MAG: TetR/AcrR family transcriptional regulator [Candidatus Tectomicrobia bacterium]